MFIVLLNISYTKESKYKYNANIIYVQRFATSELRLDRVTPWVRLTLGGLTPPLIYWESVPAWNGNSGLNRNWWRGDANHGAGPGS